MSNWLEDFLACRKQRVTIGEASSKWSDVLSGVPRVSFRTSLVRDIHQRSARQN